MSQVLELSALDRIHNSALFLHSFEPFIVRYARGFYVIPWYGNDIGSYLPYFRFNGYIVAFEVATRYFF